ncbi:MAG: exodeoxyribonuclease VII large subunit [Acidimicrobiales bacterium]|nr:exodeoxyribonuclease VII large subunit [Acidimicrobiales bacterium]
MTLFDDVEPTEPSSFSVAELSAWLREIVQARMPDDLWVEGEIRNLSRSRAGHVYFDLVEPAPAPGQSHTALLSVVLFNSTRELVNRQLTRAGGAVRVTDGVHVRIRAIVDFYPPQGRLQLRMTGIDPTYTLGLLATERDRLLRALAEEDLLDANKRVPFPRCPVRVGVITRSGSAACADFLEELAASATGFEVILVDTAVQGEHAHWSIAASIRTAERHGVDVIAVVRGGGARTDLVAFDSELVARAIATRSVPVLTGIGHEVDTTVADEVAHLSLKTPTACAAQLVHTVRAFAGSVDETWGRIVGHASEQLGRHDDHLADTAHAAVRATTDTLRIAELRATNDALVIRHHAARQLDRQAARLGRASARIVGGGRAHVGAERSRLTALRSRLERAAPRAGSRAARDLDSASERLRLLDPATTLARGWSIVRTADGTLVRSIDQALVGTELVVSVADGELHAATTAVNTRVPEDQ